MTTKKLTQTAILAALALALSLLERLLPLSLVLPLPGVKLGLSNLVTLFALYTLGLPYAAAILLLRVVLGSVFSGSVTALLYSLVGGLLSLGTMALLKRFPGLSIYGVSVGGAAMHAAGQILAAALLLGSASVVWYLPALLGVSVLTGLLIGGLAAAVLHALAKVKPAS